jgi:dolichol kinase
VAVIAVKVGSERELGTAVRAPRDGWDGPRRSRPDPWKPTYLVTVAAVFALVSLILTACSAALVWAGVKLALDGQAVAAAIGISVSTFVSYGSYLLARTAWRTHKAADDPSARRRQSRSLRFSVWYVVTILLASLLFPLPGIARVAVAVMAFGGTVVAMAAREDGLRRRK